MTNPLDGHLFRVASAIALGVQQKSVLGEHRDHRRWATECHVPNTVGRLNRLVAVRANGLVGTGWCRVGIGKAGERQCGSLPSGGLVRALVFSAHRKPIEHVRRAAVGAQLESCAGSIQGTCDRPLGRTDQSPIGLQDFGLARAIVTRPQSQQPPNHGARTEPPAFGPVTALTYESRGAGAPD
jgi:hypothetical protein